MIGEVPPLVPLQCALELLHTGDLGVLKRPPHYRRYDTEIRDRLLERLAQTGARVRGNIDGAPESWIEPIELLNDYRVGYWHAMKVGWVACLESHVAYPADLVRDRNRPASHPAAVNPNYRRLVLNVKVETAPLLSLVARTWWRAKMEREWTILCLPPLGQVWGPCRPTKPATQLVDNVIIPPAIGCSTMGVQSAVVRKWSANNPCENCYNSEMGVADAPAPIKHHNSRDALGHHAASAGDVEKNGALLIAQAQPKCGTQDSKPWCPCAGIA